MGLLNKLSPRNSEHIINKIVNTAHSMGLSQTTTAVVNHALIQPMYLNLLIRTLGELSLSSANVVSDVVQSCIRKHMETPFLSNITYLNSTSSDSNASYDAYCLRVKNVSRLKSMVLFTVGCIRACLVGKSPSLSEYEDIIMKNLRVHVGGTPSDIEIMLEVIEVYKKATTTSTTPTPDAEKRAKKMDAKIMQWRQDVPDDLMTPRARFKVMDILSCT